MSFEVRVLTLGLAATNCYIVSDSTTGETVLIDPVDQPELLLKTLTDNNLTLKLILATHGHFDHVLASAAVKEATGAPFYIHADDVRWLNSLPEQGLRFTGTPFPVAAVPDRLLTDEQETITVGNISFKTLFTPGHSPGHIAFWWPDANLVFSGDALFQGSIGRTDLPGGDHDTLIRSIFDKLMSLEDDTQVLPGHGDATTIGAERRYNPYLQLTSE
ncbi:MAG: MBL fold metallo-hydrolase [Chloroflexi bacterium]|nr:MBL fold metallo-hydrolase [Chloroflexota bacterium]